MDKYVNLKRSLAVLICFSMLFVTACGGSGGETDRAMGRYVETRLDYPLEDKDPGRMIQRPDGTIDVYYSLNEWGTKLVRYNSENGEKWEKHEVPWELPEQKNINISAMAYDKDGATWLTTMTYSEEGDVTSKVYKASEDGALTPVNIDWKDESGAPLRQSLMGIMAVADNGDLLIEIQGNGIAQYTQEGKLIRILSGNPNGMGYSAGFATYGDKIYLTDTGSGAVLCYSLEDGSLIQDVAFDNFTDSTEIVCGQKGDIYLVNRNGIFRMAEGGSMWEKLVDGGLTSMIIPSLYFAYLIEGNDGAFYMQGGGEQEMSQLYRYAYDETIATLPEKELVVYSLYENSTLQQAAGEFQRNNPDTRVNIQIASGSDSAATESDLIRALNTELLSGKGPDVLLLDGMPVDSYIEKGVLGDLSGLLKEIKADKTMNDTVVNTYKNADGVFAVPTKFGIPVLFTDAQYAKEMKDLESLAAFAAGHGDKPLIGDKSPQHLMEVLFPSCAPAWIEDGTIDETGLKTFLESIKTIADTPAKTYTPEEASDQVFFIGTGTGGVRVNQNKKRSDDIYHWAFGRAWAFTSELQGGGTLLSPMLAMRKVETSSVNYLPGQVEGVYIPMSILGVNAKSEMADSAQDFIEMMLSDSFQQATNEREGFPVNLAAMDAYVAEIDEDIYFSTSGDYDDNEELEGGMPMPEEKRPIKDLCNSVKTPYKADSALAEMIINEAQGYFTGEKDIAQTISDIGEATKLYLSE